jgi:cell wall assembly regulator SMI1
MSTRIEEGDGPITEAAIAAAEQELGVVFPPDYRAFLAQYNGGRPEPDGFRIDWEPGQVCGEDWRTSAMSWFYAIREQRTGNLVRMNKVTFVGRLPPQTLTIASDAGGNQILLALGGPHAGKVLLWVKDHGAADGAAPGYGNVGVIGDSFAEFLTQRLY